MKTAEITISRANALSIVDALNYYEANAHLYAPEEKMRDMFAAKVDGLCEAAYLLGIKITRTRIDDRVRYAIAM